MLPLLHAGARRYRLGAFLPLQRTCRIDPAGLLFPTRQIPTQLSLDAKGIGLEKVREGLVINNVWFAVL